jgi:hypothetical protein
MSSTREEKMKRLGPGIAIALLLAAVGTIGYQVAGGRTNVAAPSKQAFYSEDAKTAFRDRLNRISPFDHNGKKAYRVDVFKGADGKEFVGLMYRHTESGRREMEDYISKRAKDPDGTLREGIESRGMQVKPPGADDKAWKLADIGLVERLRANMKTASGQPAEMVTP